MPKTAPNVIDQAVQAAGFPATIRPTMVAIALKESGGDTTAENPSGAYGLWQIMPGTARWLKVEGLYKSPKASDQARAALAVWRAQGFQAWVVCGPNRTKGSCPGVADRLGEGELAAAGGVVPSLVDRSVERPADRVADLIRGIASGELLMRGVKILAGMMIVALAANALIADLTGSRTTPLGKAARRAGKVAKTVAGATPAGRAAGVAGKAAGKAVKVAT